jgi:hypothetical protein
MTPKEKAKEIYSKMLNWQPDADKYIERNIISTTAKKCALIAVDEIINSTSWQYIANGLDYWNEVKHEIEKL